MTDEKITRDDLLIVQDPMATTSNAREGGGDRNRMLEKMDHVITKKGANFIGSKGGVKKEGGSINADAMSEDVKRALDALKTKEAKEAFKGGGGGKVAEMEMKKANDARNNDPRRKNRFTCAETLFGNHELWGTWTRSSRRLDPRN